MAHAKSATGNRHESPSGRSPSPAEDQMDAARLAGQRALRQKTELRAGKLAQPLRQKIGRVPQSNQLVCRYCGSDDLAPSFIERRDRRCRKCFTQRYGSAARAKKAKVNK